MARDPEIQKLVDEAALARERAARVEPEAAVPSAPRSPIRFAVYRRMHDGGMSIVWFLPLAVVGGLLFLVTARWFHIGSLVYLGALGVRLAIYAVGLYRGYREFREFPRCLAFPIEGWLSLLDEELTTDPEQWRDKVSLEVTLAPGADREVIEAALDLCTRDANGRFYTGESFSGSAGDIRKRWRRAGTRIEGSANIWVIGDLYRCARKLDWIHGKSPSVAQVAVTASGGVYGVSRPSAD